MVRVAQPDRRSGARSHRVAHEPSLADRSVARLEELEDVARFLPRDWSQFSDAEQYEIMWDFVTGFQDVLEAVTPEDLAVSSQLEWAFVVRDCMVHKVNSPEHARALLAQEPA